MNKSLRFCILLTIILFSFTVSIKVDAATKSVTDCLEKNADCEQPAESSTEDGDTEKSTLLSTEEDTEPLWVNFIKLFFALALILGLIYLLLKFLKKKNALFNQVKSLENLGGISVGQNKSIQIIRVGSKFYLIGVGDNVEMLQEIDDEALMEDLLKRNTTDANSPLSTLVQRVTTKETTNSDSIHSKQNFKGHFVNELDKLKKNRTQLIQQYKQKEDQNE
ncbi:MAG: flagellar biosynthetic protein FliO [Bacillota bacterium]|uniref:flagellar biosynthetic protein FliO n=1 Tax=Virgibacillus TaxID=84406 RepID=UPI0013CEA687|nr:MULTISPECIES: flagellar biosynthetic protein FliO [Virgibacillus]MCC2249270.1 flagellar biosynthetic protein FliO [Virgibacillus sp. AGTR]MDY7043904.1 flagellar biosynthetic protein FliO [Virgibacillus sp. M23]QRZ17306.1 flagellar biosynthetic protein FliO [Virgibacillus sp. AGTR]WBX79563.1 flagellar biosynthetic protein FliO [Virgibacillus salarius]